jgi:hypothetical protein
MLLPSGHYARTLPPTAHELQLVRLALADGAVRMPEFGGSSPAILRGTLT